MKTGWPPGLLQDDCAKLSRWFASRPDARYVVRKLFGDSNAPREIIPLAENRARDVPDLPDRRGL
jgi:hypothetical protein